MDISNTQRTADQWPDRFLAKIDAAPDPVVVEFLERVKANSKGPTLPRLPVPQDNTAAMIALLADGAGSIPLFLRTHEPEAFDRGIIVLALNGFGLELRGGTHYYLKAKNGPGSLRHLRSLLEADVKAALYRDHCSRELHALTDRLHHYAMRRELAEHMAKRAARAAKKEAKAAATVGEHSNG